MQPGPELRYRPDGTVQYSLEMEKIHYRLCPGVHRDRGYHIRVYSAVMYKSSAVLQPSENMTKKAQLLAAFSSALPISISDGGEKTQTIVNYLNSRTMQAWMINEFNLLASYTLINGTRKKSNGRTHHPIAIHP